MRARMTRGGLPTGGVKRREGEIIEVGSTQDICNHPREQKMRNYVNGLYG
jgi:ABC-type phosphate transport system ATPase subunit